MHFLAYLKQKANIFFINSFARPSDRNRSILLLLRRPNDCSIPLVMKRMYKCYVLYDIAKRNSENKHVYPFCCKIMDHACVGSGIWTDWSGPLSPHFRRFDFSRALDVPGRKINHPPLRAKSGMDQFDFEYNILRYERRVEKNGTSNRLVGEYNNRRSKNGHFNFSVFRRYRSRRDFALEKSAFYYKISFSCTLLQEIRSILI